MSAPLNDTQDLAPALVARVALWPLDAVRALGDPELAQTARDDAADYERRYADAVERQREALWRTTAEDDAFGRGLALTNPALFEQAARGRPTTVNKRARHLDTTLYRHLARAAGRTEPCDVWAGVAVAPFGARTEVRPRPLRLAFAPELAPLRAIWRAIVQDARYGRRGLFKLNPTLAETGDGAWVFCARGERQWQRLVPRAWLADALRGMGSAPPLSWDALAERLGPNGGARLEELRARSIVVGGLSFPRRFATPWHALAAAGADLDGDHRRAWSRAVRALRRLCRELERAWSQMSPHAVADRQRAAAEIVATLAAALALPPPTPVRTPLRCDAEAPWQITLGPEWHARLAATLVDAERLRRDAGLAAAADAVHRDRLLHAPSNRAQSHRITPLTTWQDLCRMLGDPPPLARVVRAWDSWIATGHWPEVRGEAPPLVDGALGALIVGVDGARLTIRGTSPEVALLYARFGALLRNRRQVLHRWLQGVLGTLERRHDLALVELVPDEPDLPNSAARPDDLVARAFDPWGTTPDQVPAAGARFVTDAATGAPFLSVAGEHRPLVVVALSAVDLGRRDPGAERLLLTSSRVMPPWASIDGTPFEAELGAGPTAPLRLPCGATGRPWRHVLGPDEVAGLAQASRPERFRRWQRLAAAHDWPELLWARIDGRAPLLVARDSPLAVEAAFEGSQGRIDLLIVDGPADAGWLEDEGGRRHATELAVPFVRGRHAWSSRTGQMDPDERRAG